MPGSVQYSGSLLCGRRVVQDYEKAYGWYSAATQGLADAENMVGDHGTEPV